MKIIIKQYACHSSVLAVIFLIILSVSQCKCDKKLIKNKGIMTFIAGNVSLNGKKPKIGQIVKDYDMIKTGKDSAAIIQFGNVAVIALKAYSKILIQQFAFTNGEKPKVKILQTLGSTFNKISRNKSNYTINTPTATAGVRGTSFEVVIKNHDTTIKLLHGKVAANALKFKTKELALISGKRVTISSKKLKNMEKLTKNEFAELTELDKIKIMKKISSKQNFQLKEETIIPKKSKSILINYGNFKSRIIKKDKYSINYLQNRFGTLSKIYIKSRGIYIGAFKQQKNSMVMIHSTKGIFQVHATQLIKALPYQD